MRRREICSWLAMMGLFVCADASMALGLADVPFDQNLPAPILAGEIILTPSRNSPTTNDGGASRMRESARDQRKGQQSAPVLLAPDEEEGFLAPRRVPSGAADNVAKARASRLEGESPSGALPSIILAPGGENNVSQGDGTASQKAHSNRMRAIEYRKGEQASGTAVGRSTDGLPVVDCSSVDSVAGRIGDDTRSGSVIILIQGQNQVRVRCR